MSLNIELLRKVRDAIADEDNPVKGTATPGTKQETLCRLLDLIDRQAVAYGIYSRAIHEGANDAARDARRERWAERRDATEDALREALGMEPRK